MISPFVSVLMATYNCGRFIGEAIQSILNQTYEHFELIIIDDASTDNTQRVIDGFDDDRIISICRTTCSGSPALARNEGLALAQGNLIAIADADDINMPERFEKQVAFFEQYPDIDLLGGAMMRTNEAGMPSGDLMLGPQYDQQQQYREQLLAGKMVILNPTKMYQRHILDKLHLYRHFPSASDKEFLIRASRYYSMYNLEDVLVFYRRHQTTVTNRYGNLLSHYHNHIFLAQEYFWLEKEIARLKKEEKGCI